MPERKTITIPVGPMYVRGDLVKAPEGSTSKARNCVFRRGVVEKRPGFLYESDASVPTSGGPMYTFTDGTSVYVTTGGISESDGEYTTGNGTWTPLTSYSNRGAVEYNNILYMLGAEASTRASRIGSFDGSTSTAIATTTRIGGTALAQLGGRLIVGSPKFYLTNGGTALFAFNSAAEWTASGSWSQPTGTTVRLATIAHATNDVLTSTAAVYTTGAAEEYVTIVFEIQAVHAEDVTPIKVSIQDSAGTTTYGLKQYVVPNATDDPEWRKYYVTALCPASTALYAKLQVGNDTGGGTVGVTFRLSDSDNNHGFAAYPGRFIYPYGAETPASVISGTQYKNRFYWSEALDFTDWRTENFSEIDEATGTVTAMGVVNDRLVIFKRDGIWVYRSGPSFLLPFLRDVFLPGVGTIQHNSVTVFDNVMYFVSDNEVYSFDAASPPKPLCGQPMKDEIFNTQISSAVVAVDTDNRELWVYARAYRIYIYSIDEGMWIGYYQLTGSTGSEEPFSDDGVITGMVYAKPTSSSYREMWITFTTALNTSTVAKLRASQTLDNLDGTERNVVAEYVFHPLEGSRPRRQITVQEMGIDHKITGTQAASTTEYAFSTDGGSTFSKYNQVRVPVSTGASTDTDPIRVPLHQTAPRVVLKIKHDGAAGPAYFNLTGAEASVLVRGREKQASNPTAVGSSL